MSGTTALKQFKKTVGSTNFYLNTVIVGLEAVKEGKAIKTESLEISWNPKDLKIAAIKSRQYVTRATLVLLVDAIDQYLFQLGSLPGYIKSNDLSSFLKGEVCEIAEKDSKGDTNIRKRRPNVHERFTKFSETFPVVSPKAYLTLVHLLICWRNRSVHSNSKDDLLLGQAQQLKANASYFKSEHSGIDIGKTIDHFRKGKAPTLKDLSTMVAVVQRTFNQLDEQVVENMDHNRAVGFILANELSKIRGKGKIDLFMKRKKSDKEKAFMRILSIAGIGIEKCDCLEAYNEFLESNVDSTSEIIEKYKGDQ